MAWRHSEALGLDRMYDSRAVTLSKTRYKARIVIAMGMKNSSRGLRDTSTRHLRNWTALLVIKSRCLNLQQTARDTPIPSYSFQRQHISGFLRLAVRQVSLLADSASGEVTT